jgi:hypothetical protein
MTGIIEAMTRTEGAGVSAAGAAGVAVDGPLERASEAVVLSL